MYCAVHCKRSQVSLYSVVQLSECCAACSVVQLGVVCRVHTVFMQCAVLSIVQLTASGHKSAYLWDLLAGAPTVAIPTLLVYTLSLSFSYIYLPTYFNSSRHPNCDPGSLGQQWPCQTFSNVGQDSGESQQYSSQD